ncbi:MAG: cyclic nucleotide-binding domain-containing protein [Bdellovibrionaceae bacterium]|nr:cyclic nucleotide-binding domain-containing protein [Pseudobdellovibrionaceae bacterium]
MVNYLWDNIFNPDAKEKQHVKKLRDCFLFSSLTTKEILFLKDIVHIRKFNIAENIFKQGEMGVALYILAKGNVDIFVEDIDLITKESKEIFVTRLKQGDFFGEIALAEKDNVRTATAKASTEVQLIGLSKPDLLEITERSPSMGVKILLQLGEVLGKRLKQTGYKIEELRKEMKTLSKHQKSES